MEMWYAPEDTSQEILYLETDERKCYCKSLMCNVWWYTWIVGRIEYQRYSKTWDCLTDRGAMELDRGLMIDENMREKKGEGCFVYFQLLYCRDFPVVV